MNKGGQECFSKASLKAVGSLVISKIKLTYSRTVLSHRGTLLVPIVVLKHAIPSDGSEF
jgi:hypothetical protein